MPPRYDAEISTSNSPTSHRPDEVKSLGKSSEVRQRTQSTMLLKPAIKSWALLAIIKMKLRLVKVSVKPSLHNPEAVKYSREVSILCAMLDRPSVV